MGDVIFFLVYTVVMIGLGYVFGVNHTLDFLFKNNLIDEELYEHVTSKDESYD